MKNHLLLIGIDNYKYHNKLNCCVKDCADLKDILENKYNFNNDDIVELYNDKASNLQIQQKFKEYVRSLNDQDNLIIYYSGHGGFDKTTEKGFWIPYDSTTEDFTTWIPNDIILVYFKQIKAKHIFLISDSCFSRSILLTEQTKGIFSNAKDYDFYSSRWCLTSGADECMDGAPGENSYFGEVLMDILRTNSDDLRVSSLIEKVKTNYNTNILQKPQGYPLIDPKHKGGEFIFKVSNTDFEDNVAFKGYRDFLTILQLYKRNANFKEIASHENKTQKIGFQIYQEIDSVLKKATYFMHLYEGIYQQKTLDYLKQKYSEIFREKALVIIISREKRKELANPQKRKQNINEKFLPLNIFYVDEFIRELCNPKNLNKNSGNKYLDIPNFIVPSFTYNTKAIETQEFFDEWIEHDNEPIMVLKGEGGIGKTTFAQFIADKFIKTNPDATVLFIDSSEVRTELVNREKTYDNIKIYNFYEALFESTGESQNDKLNEDLFRINLDAGNFLLIIDGLDEVISKVPRFNVDEFLHSIINYSSDIGKGKVIVTCRSYFWETTKFSSGEIKTLELLPFNELQTKCFFEKSFFNDKGKVQKGQKIAEEFKFKDDAGDAFFHPYVLDVIRSIVESDQQIINTDSTFSSKILEKSVKNDYIIYRICYRERLRVEQISVDEQVEFFSYWSIKRRGVISLENFDKELIEALGKHVDKTTIEAFKSHPFIQLSSRNIRFKYDFFADYFKCIFVSRYLIYESEHALINEDFVKIVSENCWYGSSMISDIKKRIIHWTENDLLKCSDLVNQILDSNDLKQNQQRKCLSGLFNVCLAVNIRFRSNNIEQNTELMKSLFGVSETEIQGLHIIDTHSSDDHIKFDFSNLILRECFFDNYHSFWHCRFNESTYFINTYLLNLEFDSNNRKIPIPKQNFQNCTTDTKFSTAFKKDEINNYNSSEQIQDFFREFFGLFYSRGQIQDQTINKPHKGHEHHPPLNKKYSNVSNQILPFDEVIDFLKKEQVIEFYTDFAEEKVKIVNIYKNEILKFIKDGTISLKITTIISQINDLLRE